MNSFEFLVDKFNFRKKMGVCMAKECSAKSAKEMSFREFHLEKHIAKDLAKIIVCEEHSDVGEILSQLSKLTGENRLIRVETKDL